MALKFANWFTTFVFGLLVGTFATLTFVKMTSICFPNPSSSLWLF